MGLQVDNKTIALEHRYMGFAVNKLPDGSVQAAIATQVGYYDNGLWVAVKGDTITLDNDATSMLFGMKASHVGLNNPQTVALIDRLVYGVMDGSIPITTDLTVNCNINASVVLKRQGVVKASVASGQLIKVGVVLGATIEVSAPGYITSILSFPVLNGIKDLTVTLQPEILESPITT